jgi:parvulin-like peptidyl-prolyl isomerase
MSRKVRLPNLIFLLIIAAFFLTEAFTDFSITRWVTSQLASGPKDTVARVAGTPITHRQVERSLRETLWLSAKPIGDLTPEQRKTAYAAALDELIDHELLRAKLRTATPPPTVGKAEIDQRIQRLVGRFETKGSLESAMKTQGIPDEIALKNRLAARIQQEKWLETQIAKQIIPTDAEAQQWYSENQKLLENPARLNARHIFIATLDHPPEEAKQKLDEALAALLAKQKDFATLAREISDDLANKESGGELGWMTYRRLPADLAAPLFSLKLNQPTLIRSRLGWHLAEVTARKPAEPRSFEQAKPEIFTALSAIKRQQALTDFRTSLRTHETKNIVIFPEAVKP